MKRLVSNFILFVFSLFVIIFLSYFTIGGDTMTVEANIFASYSSSGGDIIRVEVPDYLFFGNLTKGEKSEEMRIYINNTGNVAINVKPVLTESDEIFENLYFRELKTSNGTAVAFSKLGSFNFNISQPPANSIRSKYIYTILDLSDYDNDIPNDLIGHQANVKFMAVKQ